MLFFIVVLQLNCIPPDACSEFSFSRKGQLILSASRPGSSLGSAVSNGTAVSSASSEQLQRWLHATAKVRDDDTIAVLPIASYLAAYDPSHLYILQIQMVRCRLITYVQGLFREESWSM